MSKKLERWFNAGMPSDSKSLKKFKIKDEDIVDLQNRVFEAIATKMLHRNDRFVFAQHDTPQ